MKKVFFLVLVVGVVIALAQPGFAQVQKLASSESQAPGKVKVEVEESTATVASVDYENRTGTLKLPDGTVLTFEAGPEVKNFDLLKVGDKVVIR
jgi:hypothetical protein